jgi:hypothetical protein
MMAFPLTFLYPPSVPRDGVFTFDERSAKIARHSRCSACDCLGWHPPEGCNVVIADGSQDAQAALDEAEDWTEATDEGFWKICACGDTIEDHGNTLDIGTIEVERRARVAIRIDEILEVCVGIFLLETLLITLRKKDKGLLSDFITPLHDMDVMSLRK